MKHITTLLICLTTLSTLSLRAETYTGTCGAQGDNLKWSLDTSTGILTITGSGKMKDYSFGSTTAVPWYDYNSSIKKLSLSSSLTTIGSYAFRNCSNLESVNIPDNVTNIGSDAFEHCSNLKSVNIPNNLKWIESYTFYDCSSLTSVTIPSSVNNIDYSAFLGCDNLENIYVSNDNTTYCDIDGVLFSKDKKTLYIYSAGKKSTAYSVPTGTVAIKYQAFQSHNLTSVNIPATVNTIYNYAFDDYYCDNLENIYVSSTNTTYCDIDGVLFSKDKKTLLTYPSGKSATTYTVPSETETIGSSAFSSPNLTSITITNSISKVSTDAIIGCKNLKNIYVTTSNTSYCDIDGVLFSKNKDTIVTYPKGREDTEYNIPDGVKLVEAFAFNSNDILTSVTLPNTVTEIGNLAFYNTKLESVIIPENVTKIGYRAFNACNELRTITSLSTTPPTLIKQDGHYDDGVFDYTAKWHATVYVPTIAVDAYKSAEQWKDFSYIKALESTNTYTLTLNTNNFSYGTVTGSGTYYDGTKVTITATPNTGYKFTQWSDGNTSDTRTITITKDQTLTATFEKQTYTLTLYANYSSYGIVTGGGTYEYGEEVTITATPKTGYKFKQWSDGNTSDTRTITITKDQTLTATFEKQTCTLTLSPNISSYGTVTGGGTYEYGDEVTIKATPNTGYKFIQWSDGDTTNPRTITITTDLTRTAYFEQQTYTITIASNNTNFGTVSNSGTYTYAYGSTIICTATPKKGARFLRWSDGSTDKTRKITVTSTQTYTAIFTAIPSNKNISYDSYNSRNGVIYPWGTLHVASPQSKQPSDIQTITQPEPKSTQQPDSEPQPVKILYNGAICLLLPDGSIYSLTGQKIK